MAHSLRFNDVSCAIADYLVVYPFTLNGSGCLLVQPHRATAVFSLISAQVPANVVRVQETKALPTTGDFAVWDDEQRTEILKFSKFDVKLASTPASLDRSVATWLLRGALDIGVSLDFQPLKSRFANFAKRRFWGATLEADGNELLHASLSMPVYSMEHRHIVEYCALGPAGSADDSVFAWVARNGAAPVAIGAGGVKAQAGANPLGKLTVKDLGNQQTTSFFGGDDGGLMQIAGSGERPARGAVFVMNGSVLRAQWPAVVAVIRDMASANNEGQWGGVMERLPMAELYQSVSGTAAADKRTTADFSIETPDYEGIALWGLGSRGGADIPIHR